MVYMNKGLNSYLVRLPYVGFEVSTNVYASNEQEAYLRAIEWVSGKGMTVTQDHPNISKCEIDAI
jgi:hypothetical protein